MFFSTCSAEGSGWPCSEPSAERDARIGIRCLCIGAMLAGSTKHVLPLNRGHPNMPFIHGILVVEFRHEELSSSPAGTDQRPTQGGGRADIGAGDHFGAGGH